MHKQGGSWCHSHVPDQRAVLLCFQILQEEEHRHQLVAGEDCDAGGGEALLGPGNRSGSQEVPPLL